MQKFVIISALLILGASFAGCSPMGRQVKDGIDCYRVGYYPGAIAQFEDLQYLEPEMNNKTLARYLVFRGLSYYHIGRYHLARHYLNRGAHVLRYGSVRWLPKPARYEMYTAMAWLNSHPTYDRRAF